MDPRARGYTKLVIEADRFFAYDPGTGYLIEDQPFHGFPTHGAAQHWLLLGGMMSHAVCQGAEIR